MKRQGIIKKVFFKGAKDFCILLCRCENNELIIKGVLPSPEAQQYVIFDGELKEDNKHRSYINTSYLKLEEEHTEFIKGVFSGLNIWGLGPKSVIHIMDIIGVDPITSISLNPEIINQCHFLSPVLKEAIRVRLAPCDKVGIFNVLNHWGFSDNEQRLIFEAWDDKSIIKILSNPFDLTTLKSSWLAKAVNLKQRLNPELLPEKWLDEIIVSLVQSKHRLGFSGGGVRSLIQQASRGVKSLGDIDWKAALDATVNKGELVFAPNGLVQSSFYAEKEKWLCTEVYKRAKGNNLCVWEYDSSDTFYLATTSFLLAEDWTGKCLFVSESGGSLSKVVGVSLDEINLQEVKLDDLEFVDFSLIGGVFLHNSVRWSLNYLHKALSLIPKEVSVILSHFFYDYSEGYYHPLLDLLKVDVLPVINVDHILNLLNVRPPPLNQVLVRHLELFQVPPATKNGGINYINVPQSNDWTNNLKVEINLLIEQFNRRGEPVSVIAPMRFGELSLKVMANEIKGLHEHRNLVAPNLTLKSGGLSQAHVLVPVTKKLIDIYGLNWWIALFWRMSEGRITLIGDIDAFKNMATSGAQQALKETTIGSRWMKQVSSINE